MAVYFRKFGLPLAEDCAGKGQKEGRKDTRHRGKEKHDQEHRAGLELLKESLFREFSEVFSCPEEEFCLEDELDKTERGKPWLKNYPQIQFNISHGKDMVVCGVGHLPLGVDVEAVRPVKSTVFRRVLTQEEQNWLKESEKINGKDGWYRDFFRLWTLKESWAKAIGEGLAVDFTRLEFRLPIGENDRKEEEDSNGLWLFPGRKEEEKRRKKQEDRAAFLMEEVRCFCLDGGGAGEKSWRFFQTVIDGEYVVSCCTGSLWM